MTTQTEQTQTCPKCGGTGFWCLGYVNGQPISNTGFACFKCNGTGRIASRSARKAAKLQQHEEEMKRLYDPDRVRKFTTDDGHGAWIWHYYTFNGITCSACGAVHTQQEEVAANKRNW